MNQQKNSSPQKTMSSQELYQQACEVLPGGVSRNTVLNTPHPHYVTHASGCYIYDREGNKSVDLANNMATHIHGHTHPEIIEAVTEQLKKGTAFSTGTEIEIQYAQHLYKRINSVEKIRFVNSGTEAVMSMIKAARAFTGRTKIAKAEGSYHGTYDYAEVSQNAGPQNWGLIERPCSVPVAFGTPACVLNDVIVFPYNDINQTLAILDKHAGDIACVLIDALPHKLGLVPAQKDFIHALKDWTRRNGALLAFDEVITFRLDHGGAQHLYGVKPNLTSLGKMIGGGFPIGAIGGSDEVMRVFDPREKNLLFPHSGTFSANPISMTAGLKAMELFDKEAVSNLNALTKTARKQIESAIKQIDVPLCITGAGSCFKLQFSHLPPKSYRDSYQDGEKKRLQKLMIDFLYEKGFAMTYACSAFFSTAITQKEVDLLTEACLEGFKKFKPQLDRIKG